jgi:hypothetical protein
VSLAHLLATSGQAAHVWDTPLTSRDGEEGTPIHLTAKQLEAAGRKAFDGKHRRSPVPAHYHQLLRPPCGKTLEPGKSPWSTIRILETRPAALAAAVVLVSPFLRCKQTAARVRWAGGVGCFCVGW